MVEEKVTVDELKKIQEDLDSANKKIVSEDVRKQLDDAKAKAKEEAAKEFETNQKIKELEAEKATMKKESEDREKAASEKLAELTEKVNNYVSSKAPVNSSNPFEAPESRLPTEDLEKSADDIERASFEALINRRVNKQI